MVANSPSSVHSVAEAPHDPHVVRLRGTDRLHRHRLSVPEVLGLVLLPHHVVSGPVHHHAHLPVLLPDAKEIVSPSLLHPVGGLSAVLVLPSLLLADVLYHPHTRHEIEECGIVAVHHLGDVASLPAQDPVPLQDPLPHLTAEAVGLAAVEVLHAVAPLLDAAQGECRVGAKVGHHPAGERARIGIVHLREGTLPIGVRPCRGVQVKHSRMIWLRLDLRDLELREIIPEWMSTSRAGQVPGRQNSRLGDKPRWRGGEANGTIKRWVPWSQCQTKH